MAAAPVPVENPSGEEDKKEADHNSRLANGWRRQAGGDAEERHSHEH